MKMPHHHSPHQYIDRETGSVQTESLCADSLIAWMYDSARENARWLFNALISRRFSKMLAWIHYDLRRYLRPREIQRIFRSLHIEPGDIADDISGYICLRDIFERKIRYATCRPMPSAEDTAGVVTSPADARMLVGSFSEISGFFIKEKFFDGTHLIGADKSKWLTAFRKGDAAIFRLTPDKYHYNHAPVSGTVADYYHISGRCHSCNPGAVVRAVTPLSENQRAVTILDTDTDGGSRVGYVAMIEIAAMMIGDIVSCYSDVAYDHPRALHVGMKIRRGQPQSLYRPGSSTTVLIFEKGRVRFSEDIRRNMTRLDAVSRYSCGFGLPLVETDVRVRSEIARRITLPASSSIGKINL